MEGAGVIESDEALSVSVAEKIETLLNRRRGNCKAKIPKLQTFLKDKAPNARRLLIQSQKISKTAQKDHLNALVTQPPPLLAPLLLALLDAVINNPREPQTIQTFSSVSNSSNKFVFLSTTIVGIWSPVLNSYVRGRVILDSASQSHFMTLQFASKLGLEKKKGEELPTLGNSLILAQKRLNQTIKKLDRDPHMHKLYSEFLEEYTLGHMQRIPDNCYSPINYFGLPISYVFKSQNNSAKLRVVFDGSAPTTSGRSLNDILLSGRVQEDVFNIMLRYLLTDNSEHIILLGYCDASIAAYGAVVYLRSYCENYTPTTKLLASKSRVTPLKTISIPRLELCSCLLLSQLINKVVNSLTKYCYFQTLL
ncbi:integrase catalytic domain-containing protein [Trichonephila inaurata madagascariensis]|uniref:Integrase catalytic domain-containing protein n=1 Tax=Trichonephila inaurata madagascariensis TaxID=2747483 RepID=A0A8X7CM49_9ARAC|nr:integrase catalytic domain-containing protein [Trichonephila inaurata madagascariensis]